MTEINAREMNPKSASYRSMPLSTIQKGAIGQFAFLVAALVTGRGQIEAYTPAADNEGRDAEVRRHLRRLAGIGIQIKVAFSLSRVAKDRQPTYLALRFVLSKRMVSNDPRLWYFLAVYDIHKLGLNDTVFLIPAAALHRLARRTKTARGIQFSIEANLDPKTHDKWSPYRVSLRDLGDRLLEIIDQSSPLTATSGANKMAGDALWLGRAGHRRTQRPAATSIESKYDLIRSALLARDSISARYQGQLRIFSPVLLGTKAGDPHVLGYQFGGTSHEPLGPDGSPKNWRCLRVTELTDVKLLPGIWHAAGRRKGSQHCIDQVDVSASRPSAGRCRLRRAA